MKILGKHLAILLAMLLISCGQKKENKRELLLPDSDNGGLVLPDGFGALVVADSVGPTRHF